MAISKRNGEYFKRFVADWAPHYFSIRGSEMENASEWTCRNCDPSCPHCRQTLDGLARNERANLISTRLTHPVVWASLTICCVFGIGILPESFQGADWLKRSGPYYSSGSPKTVAYIVIFIIAAFGVAMRLSQTAVRNHIKGRLVMVTQKLDSVPVGELCDRHRGTRVSTDQLATPSPAFNHPDTDEMWSA